MKKPTCLTKNSFECHLCGKEIYITEMKIHCIQCAQRFGNKCDICKKRISPKNYQTHQKKCNQVREGIQQDFTQSQIILNRNINDEKLFAEFELLNINTLSESISFNNNLQFKEHISNYENTKPKSKDLMKTSFFIANNNDFDINRKSINIDEFEILESKEEIEALMKQNN